MAVILSPMRPVRTFLYICLLIIVGCTPEKMQSPTDGIKFTELAPIITDKEGNEALITFNVYVFSIPVVNFTAVEQVLEELSPRPLNFVDPAAFAGNGLAAGFGREDMWNKVSEQMRNAGAKTLSRSIVTFTQGNSYDISTASFTEPVQVFYRGFDRSLFGSAFSDGEGILRLSASSIPAVRGLCRLDVFPVFIPASNNELVFAASGV